MGIKQYKSDAMSAIYETMASLHEENMIDKQTMRQFNKACLTEIKPLSAMEIRTLREREHLSQQVFANYLNVTVGLISQWERGKRKPIGSSLKLLSIIQKKGIAWVA